MDMNIQSLIFKMWNSKHVFKIFTLDFLFIFYLNEIKNGYLFWEMWKNIL